jgi:hypothetical protein
MALIESNLADSTCPPCNGGLRCRPLDVQSCRYFTGTDRCNCCLVCLKGPGEECGETFGQCARHLYCQTFGRSGKGRCSRINPTTWTPEATTTAVPSEHPTTQTTTTAASSEHPTVPTIAKTEPTTSAPTETTDKVTIQSFDEYDPNKCPSHCSLEYCSDNRNKMCSVNSSEILGDDYEFHSKTTCHRTSCKACFFVEDFNPPCICNHPRCLFTYGKCMKEYVRQIKVKPLGRVSRFRKGKVLCKVPVSEVEE